MSVRDSFLFAVYLFLYSLIIFRCFPNGPGSPSSGCKHLGITLKQSVRKNVHDNSSYSYGKADKAAGRDHAAQQQGDDYGQYETGFQFFHFRFSFR